MSNKKNRAKPRKNAKPISTRFTKRESKSEQSGPIKEINGGGSFEKYVIQSDKPVIVDFWAEWCGPCKAMAPTFHQMAEEYGEDVVFAKVDTEKNPRISEQMNIRSLPTLLAFYEGEVIDMKVGLVYPKEMNTWVNKIKKKTLKDRPRVELAPKEDDQASPSTGPSAPLVETSPSLLQKVKGWFAGSPNT